MEWKILLIFTTLVQWSWGVPSPTPSSTPTSEPQWSDLELNAVSFVILSVLASKYGSTVQVPLETTLSNVTTTNCNAYPTECNLAVANHTFTESSIEYVPGFPQAVGPDLQVVVAMRVPNETAISQPPYVPKSELVNVMLGALATLQLNVAVTIVDIEPYVTLSNSTSQTDIPPYPTPTDVHVSPTPTPTPSPSPIPPPTHRPPTTNELEEHAVLLVLSLSTEDEWTAELQTSFTLTVADHAIQHCNSTPASCGILLSASRKKRQASPQVEVIFTESNVIILPGYPKAVGGNLQVALALSIPDPYTLLDSLTAALVPQPTLLIICLGMTPSLVDSTGAYVLAISIYEPPTQPSKSSVDQELILGTVIPAVVLLLLITGISAWLFSMHRKAMKAKARYDVHNYMAENEPPSVQLVNYQTLGFEEVA